MTNSAYSGLSLLLHSFCHLGLTPFVPDFLNLGFALLLRSASRPELVLSAPNIGRCGSLPTVLDFAYPASSLLARGFSRLGAAVPVPDHLRLGFILSLQSPAHVEFLPPALSLVRLGLPLLPLDMVNAEPAVSIHSSACVDVVISAPDLLHPGITSPTRSFCGPGLGLFAFGETCPGASPLLLDSVNLGLPTILRSFMQLEISLLVLDPLRSGPILLARSFTRLESSTLVCGLGRLGALPPALDIVHSGFSLSVRSLVRLGLVLFAMDFLHLGSSLPAHSLSQPGPTSSALDFLNLGSLALLRCFARLDFPLSAFQRSVLDSSPPVLDSLQLGALLSARSFT